MHRPATSGASAGPAVAGAATLPRAYGSATYATVSAIGASVHRRDSRAGAAEYATSTARHRPITARPGAPSGTAAATATKPAVAAVQRRSVADAAPVASGRLASRSPFVRSISTSARSFTLVATA